jgi:hypothetical protein
MSGSGGSHTTDNGHANAQCVLALEIIPQICDAHAGCFLICSFGNQQQSNRMSEQNNNDDH